MRAMEHNTKIFSDAASGKHRFGKLITFWQINLPEIYASRFNSLNVTRSCYIAPVEAVVFHHYYISHLVSVTVDEAHCIQEWLEKSCTY